jgi:hypothetical protein
MQEVKLDSGFRRNDGSFATKSSSLGDNKYKKGIIRYHGNTT